ncbi:DUF2783 domain-containing protein [Variovorax sp. J22R133]|uniref:DUF2783 domain-containing protein n=1 Tax=Variovorax brevis TaxID=3053503 RepID=UPI002576943D|nr:DUF2783 domain-containing protein [Variovorax sp. J22R133]MDM0116092.1 DUF2783 domain-containing protein [Variovorax sp. J22R133]
MPLVTELNFNAADDFYEALIDTHKDLTIDQSHELNAKLVLILANQIGQFDLLKEALDGARANTLR